MSQAIDAALTDGLQVEGSSEDYARIIRSITKNRGVSGKLKKIYPLVFEDASRSERIVADILRAFEAADGEVDDDDPGGAA